MVGVEPLEGLGDGGPYVLRRAVDESLATVKDKAKLAREEDLAALSGALEPGSAVSTAYRWLWYGRAHHSPMMSSLSA
jgi:hypothetical protein